MSIEEHIPEDLRERYEFHDFHHAAAILAAEFPAEHEDLCTALRDFSIGQEEILAGGGNESAIPKRIDAILRPVGWHKHRLNAKLLVDEEIVSEDTHWIDYVKGRVAFDLEWNSKDQTFDRDLYAFSRFFQFNRISVGVLLTRSEELNLLFRELGVLKKYGASTTWMGKLLPRLHAGRNGGCPVLAIGIKRDVVVD